MLDLCSKDRCSHEELLILVLDSSGESSSNKRNHSTNFHILSQKTTKLPEVILIQQPNLFLNHVSSGWMEDCENASQLAYENRQSTNQWKVLRLSGRPSIQTRIWAQHIEVGSLRQKSWLSNIANIIVVFLVTVSYLRILGNTISAEYLWHDYWWTPITTSTASGAGSGSLFIHGCNLGR